MRFSRSRSPSASPRSAWHQQFRRRAPPCSPSPGVSQMAFQRRPAAARLRASQSRRSISPGGAGAKQRWRPHRGKWELPAKCPAGLRFWRLVPGGDSSAGRRALKRSRKYSAAHRPEGLLSLSTSKMTFNFKHGQMHHAGECTVA